MTNSLPFSSHDCRHQPIAVLGAGSWGTALALHLAHSGQDVRLWSYDPTHITQLQHDGTNKRYLPDAAFPPSLHPTIDLADTLHQVSDILISVPSIGFKETLLAIKPYITPSTRILCATKGIDYTSKKLLHELTYDLLGAQPFAVLSGPSYAKEVAKQLPTAVVVASHDANFAKDMVKRFNHNYFRTYLSEDVTGVEICGVVKNILAIAVGMSDGMGFGANARSAMITRGLAEMMRLGLALNAKSETFLGLAGVGDLVLTCTDDQSRNRRFGLALGQGKDPATAERDINQVVEGKRNAELVTELATKMAIDMPITQCVWDILQGTLTTSEAMQQLLSREPKTE